MEIKKQTAQEKGIDERLNSDNPGEKAKAQLEGINKIIKNLKSDNDMHKEKEKESEKLVESIAKENASLREENASLKAKNTELQNTAEDQGKLIQELRKQLEKLQQELQK